ncbi:hypothetical protein SCLARK_001325 [Spiroplasma clarkii]|uniref:hypothetical protein n=1 Tax=Spiroplasma clarkii TaxID=2139 RepID=UPI000B57F6E9|nr:hypothetical protein [Spiroplasma clarkii]ARU91860.1 hypothetical protein SCLARK_001325 [Spiroplasma clarkii]
MKKYPYKHIVSGRITNLENPHPLDNEKNKSKFMEYLIEDLNIDSFEDISNDKKNLFMINFNNMYYNIFIEFPDGGGKDIKYNKTDKKVAIPFNQVAFKSIIKNYERVLVIDMYVPLDDDLKPDFSKRVYLIVDPKKIYLSKVIERESKSPSSRWVKLEYILEVMNDKTFKQNRAKNVYIIHQEKLKWFFKTF